MKYSPEYVKSQVQLVASSPNRIQAVERESLTCRATRAIREGILTGVYSLRQRLREAALAKALGVSSNVVRESLRSLEGEGVVTNNPYCGWCVFSMTQDEARELTVVRASLESLAAELAARNLDPVSEREIRSALDRILSALPRSYSEWVDLELGFHRTIWETAGNGWLLKQLNQLAIPLFALSTQHFFRPQQSVSHILEQAPVIEREGGIQGHRIVSEAILARNPAEARRTMILHIMSLPELANRRREIFAL